jgi:predicted Rossmann-fold nucleotide-binding protein
MLNEFPIIIFDKAFHKDLIEHIERMKEKGTISAEDLKLCLFTDSTEEAVRHIQDNAINKFGLKAAAKRPSSWWLFEKQY